MRIDGIKKNSLLKKLGFQDNDVIELIDAHRFSRHPEDCNWERAWRDIDKTWGPYALRKKKEFREAWLNR